MVYSFLRWLDSNVSREEFQKILGQADVYIKSNRVNRGKTTGSLKYIEICIVFAERVLNR